MARRACQMVLVLGGARQFVRMTPFIVDARGNARGVARSVGVRKGIGLPGSGRLYRVGGLRVLGKLRERHEDVLHLQRRLILLSCARM